METLDQVKERFKRRLLKGGFKNVTDMEKAAERLIRFFYADIDKDRLLLTPRAPFPPESMAEVVGILNQFEPTLERNKKREALSVGIPLTENRFSGLVLLLENEAKEQPYILDLRTITDLPREIDIEYAKDGNIDVLGPDSITVEQFANTKTREELKALADFFAIRDRGLKVPSIWQKEIGKVYGLENVGGQNKTENTLLASLKNGKTVKDVLKILPLLNDAFNVKGIAEDDSLICTPYTMQTGMQLAGLMTETKVPDTAAEASFFWNDEKLQSDLPSKVNAGAKRLGRIAYAGDMNPDAVKEGFKITRLSGGRANAILRLNKKTGTLDQEKALASLPDAFKQGSASETYLVRFPDEVMDLFFEQKPEKSAVLKEDRESLAEIRLETVSENENAPLRATLGLTAAQALLLEYYGRLETANGQILFTPNEGVASFFRRNAKEPAQIERAKPAYMPEQVSFMETKLDWRITGKDGNGNFYFDTSVKTPLSDEERKIFTPFKDGQINRYAYPELTAYMLKAANAQKPIQRILAAVRLEKTADPETYVSYFKSDNPINAIRIEADLRERMIPAKENQDLKDAGTAGYVGTLLFPADREIVDRYAQSAAENYLASLKRRIDGKAGPDTFTKAAPVASSGVFENAPPEVEKAQASEPIPQRSETKSRILQLRGSEIVKTAA